MVEGAIQWTDEIIDLIDEISDYEDDYSPFEAVDIAEKAYRIGLGENHEYVEVNNALRAGRSFGGGEPENWYILDKNGKAVRLGDRIKVCGAFEEGVIGFVRIAEGVMFFVTETGKYDALKCSKVEPDTRQGIIDELAGYIRGDGFEVNNEKARDYAEWFVGRIEALGKGTR